MLVAVGVRMLWKAERRRYPNPLASAAIEACAAVWELSLKRSAAELADAEQPESHVWERHLKDAKAGHLAANLTARGMVGDLIERSKSSTELLE